MSREVLGDKYGLQPLKSVALQDQELILECNQVVILKWQNSSWFHFCLKLNFMSTFILPFERSACYGFSCDKNGLSWLFTAY